LYIFKVNDRIEQREDFERSQKTHLALPFELVCATISNKSWQGVPSSAAIFIDIMYVYVLDICKNNNQHEQIINVTHPS